MKIPLSKRLRKRIHLELAMLQDEVIDIFYSLCKEPVFHGGTAIWRCYNGNRFSEDLDFYGKVEDNFDSTLRDMVEARGLKLTKYKRAPNVIFIKISNDVVTVRLEITKRKPAEKIIKRYEKTDGTYIDVYTLSQEELIKEKIHAYQERRLIRDVYDIYHLSTYVEGKIPSMLKFLEKLPQPIDEQNLKTIVYTGVAPSFTEMINTLKRRFR